MRARLSGIGLTVLAAFVAAGLLGSPGEPEATKAGGKLRIGTYKSRVVAMAYAGCEIHERQLEKLRLEHQKAKEAKDGAKVKELEEKGKDQQNLRHMQVFGNAPIHDLLATIPEILQEEARKARVDIIVRQEDIAYREPSVELVDMTESLARRIQPKEERLKKIWEIEKHPPLPLEEFPIEED